MKTAKTPLDEVLGTDDPVGLLAIPAEHTERRLAELAENPPGAAALQKQLFGERWAAVPRERRRKAVREWLKSHTPDRFLGLDLKSHGLL